MSSHDFILGGPQRFPSTIWSDVLAAGDPSNPSNRDRLNLLVQGYWRPVYTFIRAAWHRSGEDAKDLTQAFFTHVLEKGYIGRMRPDRGSFRAYLKQALRHFLVDAQRSAALRKPEKPLFRLDNPPGEMDRLAPASPDDSPEEAYDREWFRCLLDSSLQELRSRLVAKGKSVHYEVLRIYLIDPSGLPPSPRDSVRIGETTQELPTYSAVAQLLGIRETDVCNYLNYCRRALREILKQRIRDYVDTDGEVESELKAFFDR